MSIKLVANIAVNLIAFVALLQFVNNTLVWFGDRVGYDGLTFQVASSLNILSQSGGLAWLVGGYYALRRVVKRGMMVLTHYYIILNVLRVITCLISPYNKSERRLGDNKRAKLPCYWMFEYVYV